MNTRAKGIRLPEEIIELIQKRAAHKGWSFNKWINWAVRNGLRSHKKLIAP